MHMLYFLSLNSLPANYFSGDKLLLTVFDVTLADATLRLLQLIGTILSLHDKQESGFADSESASPASLRSSVLKLKDESGARKNPSARPAYKIPSKSAAH